MLFTEIGYRSSPDAATEPWECSERGATDLSRYDSETQVRCYQAFFRAYWHRPWFAGSYFWKWFPHHEAAGGPGNVGYTPQNKPAEDMLAHWQCSAPAADSARAEPAERQ